MVSLTTSTGIQHIPIAGEITIDLAKGFTMQSLYEAVSLNYPKDPNLTVVGLGIPILGIGCKEIGLINPLEDIKDSIARLYHKAMQTMAEALWKILNGLFEALKSFGLGILDLKLPILGLTISDLFKDDLWDKIKQRVIDLYHNSRDELIKLLNSLGIKFPFFINFQNIEKEIEHIVTKIMTGLWDAFFKIVFKVIALIETGLEIYDTITFGFPKLSIIWKKIVEALLGFILKYLAVPPSIEDIENAIIAFAKSFYNKTVLTYQELIDAIKHFKLPVFGFPLDWHLPINPKVTIPNLDFDKIITDMKIWINNFLMSIIQKFIEAIGEILSFFGLNFVIPKLKIPLTLCAIANTR